MTWQAPGSQSTTGTTVSLGDTDSVFVASNAVLASTGSNVIRGTGSDHQALVYGTVVGSSVGLFALHLGDNALNDHGQTVHVEQSGHVQSLDLGAAIAVFGYDSEVINDGFISAIGGVGVVMRGSKADTSSTLVNSGKIEGYAGVTRFGVDAIGETIVLKNSGIIAGELASYTLYASEGGAARDLITNSGKMIGDIELFKGNDLYDGRKGFVDGIVNGGEGDDRLFGGKEKSLLNGDDGSDSLSGGLGKDAMSGGGDNDIFIFRSAADSGKAFNVRDSITDFSRAEADIIDLALIDANTKIGGNQIFKFSGDNVFTHHAGELRYQIGAADTMVLGDTNGDGKADFAFEVDGKIDFVKTDFIL